jgi:hypothetical protein
MAQQNEQFGNSEQLAQHTAVEWLIEKMIAKQNGKGDSRSMDEIFEQAKEIEKQQIIDAYEKGDKYKTEISGEQYYNETYGK